MPITKQRPNIIFIVLDTHRRDRLGFYGSRRGTSPNLDAFADQATVFENAISPAQWTIPAHASMFSGEFPSTHLTTQSGDALDTYFTPLAEHLRKAGYRRTGFCNNPLVGVLDNNLTRGFERFYNYGGAVPSTPADDARKLLWPLSYLWERYTQLLRRISYPIQNAVAKSDRVFQLTLHPLLVPLWSRFANFKGNTPRSVEDTLEFVHRNLHPAERAPHFVFFNLMETHLPYTPPDPFISRFAPYFKEERPARDFMRIYNTQALRWLIPMEEPFSELESRTLSDLYDAEVAYQDHLLGALLEELDSPYHRENSLIVFVADHGELLGEHSFMGHGISVYQELIHVPLMVRFPGQSRGRRISTSVSTAQLFHTVLDAAGVAIPEEEARPGVPVERLSLARFCGPTPPQPGTIFSEAYPPKNVLKIMEREPGTEALIETFFVRHIYRAAFDTRGYKLARVENAYERLYDLKHDPHEQSPLESHAVESHHQRLSAALDLFVDSAIQRRPENWTRSGTTLDDERVRQRLRSLGYLD